MKIKYTFQSNKQDKNIVTKLSNTRKIWNLSNYSIILIFLLSWSYQDISAQCTGAFTIFTEDFEDNGNTENGGFGRYTSLSDFYDTASDDDYWGRVHGATEEYYLTDMGSGETANSVVSYIGWNGNFFYAGEDLDDIGATIGFADGQDEKEIFFDNINITDATNMCFSGLFARGENDGCTASTYDGADYIEVFYKIDTGSEIKALCFNPDLECNIPGDISNEPLHHDPNCDGDGGEGTLLSNTFQEFTFNIAGTGDQLDLRIEIHMDAGSEEVAIDYLRIKSDTPLPINLQSFNAKKERENVMLDWATATEINNEYFLIEHSIDGRQFNEVGMVEGAGNSTNLLEYKFLHESPFSGVNYYRLQQVDFDGKFSYSPIVEVEIKSESDKLNVYPNPFTNEISVVLTNSLNKDAKINIYDVFGRLVSSDIIKEDQKQKSFNLTELDSGIYIIQIGEGNNRIVQKISKF
jgi:hypothetical protein